MKTATDLILRAVIIFQLRSLRDLLLNWSAVQALGSAMCSCFESSRALSTNRTRQSALFSLSPCQCYCRRGVFPSSACAPFHSLDGSRCLSVLSHPNSSHVAACVVLLPLSKFRSALCRRSTLSKHINDFCGLLCCVQKIDTSSVSGRKFRCRRINIDQQVAVTSL